MRERYWNFYFSIKFKACYYMYFQIFFKHINTCITCFLSLTTLSCIAAWDVWNKYQLLWANLICVSQVVQAIFPKLPYNDMLISTKFMISALDRLLLDIDHDWLIIDIHHLSDDEIVKLLEKHQNCYSDLVNQFFSGEYLPLIKYCEKKAEQECKTFFSVTYQTQD